MNEQRHYGAGHTLAQIEEAAKQAPPGPWRTGKFLPRETVYQGQVVIDTDIGPKVLLEGNQNFYEQAKLDAAYAAIANPATAMELAAHIRELQAQVRDNRAVAEAVRDACHKEVDGCFAGCETAAIDAVDLDAVIASTPQGKPVATVRVTHKGYAMELSTYIAYALPEGKHDLYAAPQPTPRGSDEWIPITERLPEEQDMYLGMLREDNPLGWTWERPVEVAFGYLLHDRQRFSVFDAWAHENVDIQDYMTHWMPLPATPKQEGGTE